MRNLLTLCLCLATSGLHFGRTVRQDPPLRLTVEIDGRELILRDGERGELDLGAMRVAVRVKVDPTRRFEGGGVSFEFPRAMAYAHEGDEHTDLWSLDGNDCIVHVQAYAGGDPNDLLGIYLNAFRDTYSPQAETPVAIELDLGGTKFPGRSLDFEVAGHRQRISAVALEVAGRPVVLVLQDTAPRLRRPSTEARELLDLWASTFRLAE